MHRLARGLLPLAVACALLGACTGDHVRRRNVIVLVDYSSSITQPELDRFASTIRRDVLSNLRAADALSVFPIDAGAELRDQRISGIDLNNLDFSRQTDGVTHRSDSVAVRLHAFLAAAADTLIRAVELGRSNRKEFKDETDILGALDEVEGQLEHSSAPSRFSEFRRAMLGEATIEVTNVVIVCSDMINESPDADFEHRPPTHEEISKLLAALRNAGRLPDLHGVDVFVVGRTGHDPKQVEAVKSFWSDYFLATGANLQAYDFDPGTKLAQYLAAL